MECAAGGEDIGVSPFELDRGRAGLSLSVSVRCGNRQEFTSGVRPIENGRVWSVQGGVGDRCVPCRTGSGGVPDSL